MKEFVDDDNGYEKWIGRYPDGYVLNTGRTGRSRYVKLHGASCGTIERKLGKQWTHHYIKVCSTDVDEIIDWVCRKYGEEPKRCGKTKDCKNI